MLSDRQDTSSALTIEVGLSAWIIQDGNYGDFVVGQEANFALEFYSKDGLRQAAAMSQGISSLSPAFYRIVGEVVFTHPETWVVSVDGLLIFQESPPPSYAAVGTLVEGEIVLGIDPFFYFERLWNLERMPSLTYKWRIMSIRRNAAPLVEVLDSTGRAHWERDESLRLFTRVNATNAWEDEDGNAEYVMACEWLGGPSMPEGATSDA